MKAKVVVLFLIVSLIFFGIGLFVGAVSFYISTTTAGIVGANDCCSYVDKVLQSEADGELDQIPIGLFLDECGLRTGFMISHEYDGRKYIEFRSFCGTRNGGFSSNEVSVVYVATDAEFDDLAIHSNLRPVYVDVIRMSDESVYGAHSTRRTVLDKEKYALYLESLERD